MRNRSDSRLLILGNGPSLKKKNFPLFKDVPCLGMNAAYRYWQRIGWYPEVYCCLDDQVVLSHAEAIAGLIENRHCKYFFLHVNFLARYPAFANAPGVYFMPQLMKGHRNADLCAKHGLGHLPQDQFLSSQPGKITTGSYALRFASFLGYRQLGLVGIDCRYTEIINEAKTLGGLVLEIGTTPKKNPNYFFDDYQVQGDRYNIPNPTVHHGNLHLQAFEALRDDIAKYKFDMVVQVCTPESELYDQFVFPYVPLADFVAGPKLSAVFVPFVQSDLDRLTRSLARWGCQEFAPYRVAPPVPSVELHLAFNGAPSAVFEDRLSCVFVDSGLSRFFSGMHFHYSKLEGLRDLYTRKFEGSVGPEGYMAGPNNQFFDIIQKFSVGMSHVALIEADAIPIRANWLAVMEDIVTSPERFWICGSHYRGVAKVQSFSHINGNAIYNVGDLGFQKFFREDFLPYFYARVKTVPNLCYDIVLHDMFHTVFAGRADEKAFGRWANIAHRFRFSEFLVDVSHPNDRMDDALLSLEQARQKYPDAYLYHGAIAKIEASAPSGERKAHRHMMLPRPDAALSVVMMDPDALDQFGHYLTYDDQLDKALRPYVSYFHILANRQLPSSIASSRRFFTPCLTDHSWIVGIPNGKTQQVDSSALSRFEEEVTAFVSNWHERSLARSVCLYMYCAGIPHAQALIRVMNRVPYVVTSIVNLFYLPFQSIRSAEFASTWLPVLQLLAADPRMVLTVPTDTLAADLQALYGLELPVTPHPSPTVEDTLFSLLQCDALHAPARSDERLSVLFPGAPTVGKGSEFVVASANHLATTRQDLRVTVRDLRRQGMSGQLTALYDSLNSRVQLLKGQVSNAEFLDIFRLSDVVVLPYMPDMFRYRNSGLLIDAIYCGKPVVVIKDTWLGNLVEKTGCGIAVQEPSPAAIDDAVTRIAADLLHYTRRAKVAARAYYAGNSWDTLARLVCVSMDGDPAPTNSLLTVSNILRIDKADLNDSEEDSVPKVTEKNGSLSECSTLCDANRRLREGDLSAAIQAYLLLYSQRPMQMYFNNALFAARKLGKGNLTSIEDLRREFVR